MKCSMINYKQAGNLAPINARSIIQCKSVNISLYLEIEEVDSQWKIQINILWTMVKKSGWQKNESTVTLHDGDIDYP